MEECYEWKFEDTIGRERKKCVVNTFPSLEVDPIVI